MVNDTCTWKTAVAVNFQSTYFTPKKTSNPVAFQKKMVEFPRFFPGPWDFLLAMCLLVSKLRNFHGLGPGRSTREGAVVLPSGAIS